MFLLWGQCIYRFKREGKGFGEMSNEPRLTTNADLFTFVLTLSSTVAADAHLHRQIYIKRPVRHTYPKAADT
jgi:hypothetical protein